MRLASWREADPRTFTRIWHAQSRRWAERLSWDITPTWATVERQRRDGTLPGLILVDDNDHIAAWSFYVVHRRTLQIGAFEADTPAETHTLLDAVLGVAEPEVAPSGSMMFAFSGAPELLPALAARGFEIDRYLYLMRDLPAPPADMPDPDWDRAFAVQMPSLLARCYGAPTLTRPFARHGDDEEWREYVGQLIGAGACGRFEPRLSAARASADGVLEGAVLATVVGPGTAHVAQVAVDPSRRGRGMASGMLRDVMVKSSLDGLVSMSLLVSEHNAVARRIYEGLGFREVASFVSAGRRAMPVPSAPAAR